MVALVRLVFMSMMLLCDVVLATATNTRTPYQVLGVSKRATQDEIKQRYRKLCLQYHPDKKHHLPESERKQYEKLFKELQSAYTQISTPEARREYDLRQSIPFHSSYSNNNNNNGYNNKRNNPYNSFFGTRSSYTDEDIRRAFQHAFQSSQSYSRRYYNSGFNPYGNSNTNDFNHFFPWAKTSTRPTANIDNMKSIYVQKVSISLEDLYSGKQNYKFQIKENIFTRLKAAFIGGIGYLHLYKSFLYILPLLRVSKLLSLLVGAGLFVQSLPQIDPNLILTANIQPGYKGGTKLIFAHNDIGAEVHIVLQEAIHPLYQRLGNNLSVKCCVSPREAAHGCKLVLPSLAKDSDDDPIVIHVPPHSSSGDQIVIPGKGWPNRKKKGMRGDLVATVVIYRMAKTRKGNYETNFFTFDEDWRSPI